jgi:hypothetical protein
VHGRDGAERERLFALRQRMAELRREFASVKEEYDAGRLRLTEEVTLLTQVSREACEIASEALTLTRPFALLRQGERHSAVRHPRVSSCRQ